MKLTPPEDLEALTVTDGVTRHTPLAALARELLHVRYVAKHWRTLVGKIGREEFLAWLTEHGWTVDEDAASGDSVAMTRNYEATVWVPPSSVDYYARSLMDSLRLIDSLTEYSAPLIVAELTNPKDYTP